MVEPNDAPANSNTRATAAKALNPNDEADRLQLMKYLLARSVRKRTSRRLRSELTQQGRYLPGRASETSLTRLRKLAYYFVGCLVSLSTKALSAQTYNVRSRLPEGARHVMV